MYGDTNEKKQNTDYIEESINISKYQNEINKLGNSLDHLIAYPEDLREIVHVLKNPKTGDIFGITINTSTEDTNDNKYRIGIKSGKEESVCGKLKCKEIIKCTSKDVYQRKLFSFHMEMEENQKKYRSFRLDFAPKQECPLHAHDDRYSDMNKKHLTYPEETDLNLHLIDFCTVLYVLSYYLKNPEQYPLEHGLEYNKITKKIRSRYDD